MHVRWECLTDVRGQPLRPTPAGADTQVTPSGRKGVRMSKHALSAQATPWQLPFHHAFDVAIGTGGEEEAVAEVLAISHNDRGVVATARANCSAILSVAPNDRLTRKAFDLLDRTLHEGDDRHCWVGVA